ncbi:MAG: efflux RND transporter periplasmic adaptor subunit [Planctomycetes bacterium]|nr:efflux RND transporter periplasmic adaptor subunit [Planctomycetota bacterium]
MKIGKIKPFILFLVLGCIAFSLLVGCKKTPPVQPKPPEVTVEEPVTREVRRYHDFTGNTEAIESVDIRARVQGFLEEIHFKDGDDVKEGDVLFTIEQDAFNASVAQSEAVLESKKAQLERAEADLARVEKVVDSGAVSEQEVDLKRADRNVAKAAVAQAKASLDETKLQLSYTIVKSPVTGRISRTFVDAGNLVGQGDQVLLTRVVRFDPMYVYSNISERLLIEFLKKTGDSGRQRRTENVKLFVSLADEENFPHEGVLNFIDNTLDAETGTVQIRGELPNKERLLYPGMFVRIRVPSLEETEALLVKEVAIGTDLGGKYVLVLKDQNIVERRYIKTGLLFDDMRVVEDGIKAGEPYIVNGLQRARPGRPVTPKKSDQEPGNN